MNLENVQDVFVLTPLQQGMLYHTISEPRSGVFVEQICTALEGELNPSDFENAWAQIMSRYDSLRTMFLWEELDEPLQVIRQHVDIAWNHMDWSGFSATEQRVRLSKFLAADRERGFELTRAPLMRMSLVREADNRWRWVWSFHHILFDGWSTAVILREFIETCEAVSRDEKLNIESPFPFRNYIEWLTDHDPVPAETFWRSQLSGFSVPTRIQTPDFPESAPPRGHQQTQRALSPALTESLHAFARDSKLTLNTVMHGAWSLLLSRLADEEDVVYGATMSGRPHNLPGIEEAVGLFINTVPVRVQTGHNATLIDWLKDLQSNLLAIRQHEHTPLSQTQACSDIPRGSALFDSILVFENYPAAKQAETSDAGFRVCGHEYHEQSNYPLALLVAPADGIELILVHDTSQYGEETAAWLLDRLEVLFAAFVNSPGTLVDEISLMTSVERAELLKIANEDRSSVECNECVHSLIEQQAKQKPDATAIVLHEQRLTYRELDKRATELAQQLRSHGVGPDVTVGLFVDRGIEMVVGILGILKAGGAYVPLNPQAPDEQIQFIVADAGIDLILTQSELSGALPQTDAEVISIDTDGSAGVAEFDSSLSVADTDNLAYVIYTSGSTGRPKGVEVTHGNLMLSTAGRFDYYVDAPECFLLLSSYAFDSSVAGIFWTLCAGGTLVLPTAEQHHDVLALANLIAKTNVTHTLCLPSLYEFLLDHAAPGSLASLKTVIVAGESCDGRVVHKHFACLPKTELHNEYGPTEATVWSTVQQLAATDTAAVPIGQAAPQTSILLLDTKQQPVPVGMPGEIYIAGPKIAKGYRNRPDLTADAFIANPFSDHPESRLYRTGDRAKQRADGSLIFLGRIDNQLKVNGHRIEAEEIEAALRAHPAVKEVVVGEVTADRQSPVSEDIETLVATLTSLAPAEAESLLYEVESCSPSTVNPAHASLSVRHSDDDVTVSFSLPGEDYIAAPRSGQRKWLLDQALCEATSDLRHLHEIVPRFVPGRIEQNQRNDIQSEKLTDNEIMEDWQYPLMKAMAEYAAETHGDVLEIGFGRGVSATLLQEIGVRSHTIIEANPYSVSDHYAPFRRRYGDRDIRIIEGRWQDVLDQLGEYDAVFFHAFPLNLAEFVEFIAESVTFAEHFFPTAAKLMRPGGVFTYLTTEIDSISRRHQRSLFKHFREVCMKVQPVTVPPDTRDAWWADSMVVLRASL